MNDRLQAYLDGRLSADERAEFERQLAAESPALLRAVLALAEHPQTLADAEPGSHHGACAARRAVEVSQS